MNSLGTKSLLSGLIMVLAGGAAHAQSGADSDGAARMDEIVVVGSQIVGSDIAGTLPVTVLSAEDIEALGASSGDELLSSIPQFGGVTFNESEFSGINGARGDIGSINLRGVGTGNTLILLNGRRLVLHPGTQVENLVPVNSVNSNALPVTGIERLEVLRDGAAAIYGTDAVAGVVNTITQDDYEGVSASIRFGASEGTSLWETSGTLKAGFNSNEDRTNVSLFFNFLERNGMSALERSYSASDDLRPLFVGTVFEGDTQLRNLSTNTPWAEFRASSKIIPTGETDNDGNAEFDDDFHIQPVSAGGCAISDTLVSEDICIDNGGSIDTALRLDRARYRDLVGDTSRQNIMGFFNHSFDNGIELFGEFTYYHANYQRQRETAQILSSAPIAILSTAHYNPVASNLQLRDYRALDTGPRNIEVENHNYRVLAGMRGDLGGVHEDWSHWNWESAVLYTGAKTTDVTTRVSNTAFQAAINRQDESAYNPFAGGNIDDIHAPNADANLMSTINTFLVPVSRVGDTSLAIIDAKFSTASLYTLPAGDIGMAVGVEWRHSTFIDDRDDRLDGTIVFELLDFDGNVTGTTSDVMGSSPTLDTRGSRNVGAAFIELAIPLVSEDMDIPLVERLDLQLASRTEGYSDVGGVIKPKIALAWSLHEMVKLRASWSQGFRAPNLEQINAEGVRRVNSNREDWIVCHEADAGFTEDDACDGNSVESVRSGGPDLGPEHNDNYAVGLVFEPEFAPGLVFTLDWWRVESYGTVGIFGDQNQLSLDYLLRLGGSSNPNVVRETTDDGTVGDILYVTDDYVNLDTRSFEGLDIGVYYNFETEYAGEFDLSLNAAYLIEAFQTPSEDAQLLLDALENGTISDLVSVGGAESLVKQNGRPEWRLSADIKWSYQNWGVGATYNHISDFIDTSVTGPDGEIFVVGDFNTLGLYAEYELEEWFAGGSTRLRLGVRNVTGEDPPIADEFASGYFPAVHSNRGRYLYFDLRQTF